jgi:hypothetical protein
VYDPEPQHGLEYLPEESIFLLVQIIDLYFYWPAQFTALMAQQTDGRIKLVLENA